MMMCNYVDIYAYLLQAIRVCLIDTNSSKSTLYRSGYVCNEVEKRSCYEHHSCTSLFSVSLS